MDVIASTLLVTTLSARDQIKIVGSSTVYPFSSSVAEEFGATTSFPTPVVESTGTGGGIKLFCAGVDINTPDIANASRAMKASEFKMCQENGVTDITEALIGFDGIAIAQSSKVQGFNVTKEQLALGLQKKYHQLMENHLLQTLTKNGQILVITYQIEKLLFMVHQNHQVLETLLKS